MIKKIFCLTLFIISISSIFAGNNYYFETLYRSRIQKEYDLYCISGQKYNLSLEFNTYISKINEDKSYCYISCGYGQSSDYDIAFQDAITDCWVKLMLTDYTIKKGELIYINPLSISKYIFEDPNEPPIYMVILISKIGK